MNSKLENQTLTIFLEGRIDTNNAAEVEKELLDKAASASADNYILDADELVYISSAGLRVLMKLRKVTKKPLTILNVSPEVYDILDVTGFTELLDVKKRLRRISIEGCEMIGSGGFGKVYRTDPETIVKFFRPDVSMDFAQGERDITQKAFLYGVPTAISYDVVKSMPPEPECYGVIYELLNAQTVGQIMEADPSRVDEMGRRSARLLKELHSIEVDDNTFPNRQKLMLDWLDQVQCILEPSEADEIRAFIKSIPDRNTFLHGDFNSKNIMVQNDEFQLIDIGDASIGHPVYDVAGLLLPYYFLVKSPKPRAEIIRLLGFNPEDAPRMLRVMFSEYFGVEDPDEVEKIIGKIMPYALLMVSYQGARMRAYNIDAMKQATLPGIRNNLLPAISHAQPLDW